MLMAVWAQFKSLLFQLSGGTSGKHIDMLQILMTLTWTGRLFAVGREGENGSHNGLFTLHLYRYA